jgi:hypothetical protein
MELKPEIRSTLEANAKYTGIIEKIEHRSEPYEYLDVLIKPDGVEYTIKVGLPANLTYFPDGAPCSNLAKFVDRFGYKVAHGDFDSDSLVGKRVEFIAGEPQKTERGLFSRVLPETIRPVK